MTARQPKGVSYAEVVEHAKRYGCVEINQYDLAPRATRYRRAVYRAVKRGLLRRVPSPPHALLFVPVESAPVVEPTQ